MTSQLPNGGQSPAARAQVEQYLGSGGREGVNRTVDGIDYSCVLLTYTGRISRRELSTPVIRVVHDGHYILVGSLGGAPQNPQWVLNLRADPRIVLRDGRRAFECDAHELTGCPRERAWATAIRTFPPYAEYQRRADRRIPLFACPLS